MAQEEGFAEVEALDQLEESFPMQKYSKPSTYCPQRLLHVGGLGVVSILD